ncbi:MAG: methylated-DNA--[protein]-cysteine S-methyltransferase [Lachnospiraceae bacterium]
MEYITQYKSPLGWLTLASDGEAITGLWIEGQKYFGRTLEELTVKQDLPVFEEAIRWLDGYFQGEKSDILFSLCPKGTEFQKSVWKILCDIPYGATITYGEIAKKIAREKGKASMSAQAVGSAVGHNPISILIPCHRVIGANGSLTGYAGGIEKKRWLLELEA